MILFVFALINWPKMSALGQQFKQAVSRQLSFMAFALYM